MRAESAAREDFAAIFKAAQRIDAAKSIRQVVAELRHGLEDYGYKACLITDLPEPEIWSLEDHILVDNWPRRWFSHYMRTGLYRFDPCAALSRHAAEPFLWSDVRVRFTKPEAMRVMNEAADFGLRDGICIPISVSYGHPAVVTAAGSAIDLRPAARCSVHAIGRHAYSAAERLLQGQRRTERQKLSPREREVLQWIAAGKTAWEVSAILGLSAATVNTHLKNIRNKLEAANVVHAIVTAVRRHEISL